MNATAPTAPPTITARVLDIWSGSHFFSNTIEEICGRNCETSNLIIKKVTKEIRYVKS